MNCIIVEDEFPAREELKYFIKNFSNINIIGEFDNGVDVLKFIQEHLIDVIFLDINIPMLDGMVLAKTIKRFSNPPKIVIVTAYKEYAVEGYELNIFDYILKPYTEDRIVSCIKKLSNSEDSCVFNGNSEKAGIPVNSKLSLWRDNRIVVVDSSEIYYCEANERETLVYTKDYQYVVNSSISEFEGSLDSRDFFRCHRSYIVNLTKIKEIIPWFNSTFILKFENLKGEVPVSRSKTKQFKSLMKL